MPELQKIRHFVMDIIYHSEGRKVKLPSLRTLSAEFGLGASTIKLEFDRLEREGYLTTRHGIGTFTNPKQYFFAENAKLPLIGIKLYRGDTFYYDVTLMKMIGELMSALTALPCNVHMMTAGCENVGEFDTELCHSHIDALLTVSVEPELVEYAARRMPTVNIGYPVAGVDNIVFRGEAAGRELAERLCREQDHPVVFQTVDRRNIAGFSEVLKNDPRLCYTESPAGMPSQEVAEILQEQHCDCVITHSKNIAFIDKLFRGETVPALVAIDDGLYPATPSCYCLEMPRNEASCLAVDRLTALLEGRSSGPQQFVLEHRLHFHQPRNHS